jgi:hypothetical protein
MAQESKFWTQSSVEPKRNFRWLVRMGADSDIIWYAKTVTVPSYEVSEVEHDFLDNKYYFPGRVTWSEITLTLVDPISPDATFKTLEFISEAGYKVKGINDLDNGENMRTLSKSRAAASPETPTGIGKFRIQLHDSNGNTLEEWAVHNAFVKSAKYGDLDYSNDDIRTIELTIRYDWAECFPGDAHPDNSTDGFEPTG